MTVRELILALSGFPGDSPVEIEIRDEDDPDEFNGYAIGGVEPLIQEWTEHPGCPIVLMAGNIVRS